MNCTLLPLRLLRIVESTCEAFGIYGDALAGHKDRLSSNARQIALAIHRSLPAEVRRIDPRAAWDMIVSAVQDHCDRLRDEIENGDTASEPSAEVETTATEVMARERARLSRKRGR